MPPPLSALLSQSWDFFQKKMGVILPAVAIAAFVLAVSEYIYVSHVDRLLFQAGQGDPSSILSVLNGALTDDQRQVLERFFLILPSTSVYGVFAALVKMGAYLYILILAVRGMRESRITPSAIAREVPHRFLPFFLLSLWIFLRSFAWIPIIGFVIAFIIGPRFALSHVLFLRDGMGILESAKQSYARTRGYWGKIVGNLIVASALAGLASFVASLIANIVSWALLSFLLGLFLQAGISLLSMAFILIFSVRLAETILLNPKKQAAFTAEKYHE